MANYYASARTNYFEVKDREAFELDLQYIPDIEVVEGEGGIAILVSDGDYGGFPSFVERDMLLDEGDECQNIPAWITDEVEIDLPCDEVEIDLPCIVANHLKDGEVAIFMECGAEKLRYVAGSAFAINNKHETKCINLSDIYDMAQALTTSAKRITVAEY